ncbi:hypothetical protein NW762_014662 [Fusarium torreyae]|uniref:Uncharacterized protein n=1 Tax=Fusarium torreyae TaxID=1237075 RepID=A0A9W8RL53_9HYPO|nr:hypothetical protein NW762_014662 [Fusarium torreyae]
MTRLRKIEWQLDDAEKVDAKVRIHQRTAFAHTLKTLPMSIESFRLEYIREPPRDRTFEAPSILPADATGDILSQELRRFSQRDGLKRLTVEASVDATILWPSSQISDSDPTWPTLEQFHIALNEVLPSGEWIEIPDPEEEEENEEPNENEAEDERLNSEIPGEETAKWYGMLTYSPVHFERFALATARAANRMTRIKDLKVTYHGHVEVGIGFTSERRVYSRGKEPYLEFASEHKFPELSEETLDVWRRTLKLKDLEWDVHFTDCGRAPTYHFERLNEIFVER